MFSQVRKVIFVAVLVQCITTAYAAYYPKSCAGDLLIDEVCKNQQLPSCGQSPAAVVHHQQCHKEERCVCPDETPIRYNDRCYKSFECPKVAEDGMSNNRTGHNFVIPGVVNDNNEVYGMHISALKLPPHWYHGIALFEITDSACAQKVKEQHTKDSGNFLSINYRVPIKLVDLLTLGKTFLGTIGLGAGPAFRPLIQCNLRVKQVLDLRRYKFDQPYPKCQKFLLFGDGKSAYMSHIPTRCKDTQQVIWLKKVPSGLSAREMKAGVVIWLPEIAGHPRMDDASGAITDALTKSKYRAYFNCEYRDDDEEGGKCANEDETEDVETEDVEIEDVETEDVETEDVETDDFSEGTEDTTDHEENDGKKRNRHGYCSHVEGCRSTKVEIKRKYPLDFFIINIMCS